MDPMLSGASKDNGGLGVPVTVWGTDPDGGIFRQRVSAQCLTREGALLSGIEHRLAMGDLLGVQYNQQKAHARVTQITPTSSSHHWLMAVELIEKSRCPWIGLEAPAPTIQNSFGASDPHCRGWRPHILQHH
jgi:hypothetical protein